MAPRPRAPYLDRTPDAPLATPSLPAAVIVDGRAYAIHRVSRQDAQRCDPPGMERWP